MAKLPVPMPPPSEMLRRLRLERKHRKYLRRLMLLAASWILLTQLFPVYRQQDLGMYPSVRSGDIVLTSRFGSGYVTDTLVLYRAGDEQRLGRIVALEGDTVMMGSSGRLTVNGTVQNGDILFPTYGRPDGTNPQQVPEDMVYILGDHRTQSYDSRDHGCVHRRDILGKAIIVLRTGQL